MRGSTLPAKTAALIPRAIDPQKLIRNPSGTRAHTHNCTLSLVSNRTAAGGTTTALRACQVPTLPFFVRVLLLPASTPYSKTTTRCCTCQPPPWHHWQRPVCHPAPLCKAPLLNSLGTGASPHLSASTHSPCPRAAFGQWRRNAGCRRSPWRSWMGTRAPSLQSGSARMRGNSLWGL